MLFRVSPRVSSSSSSFHSVFCSLYRRIYNRMLFYIIIYSRDRKQPVHHPLTFVDRQIDRFLRQIRTIFFRVLHRGEQNLFSISKSSSTELIVQAFNIDHPESPIHLDSPLKKSAHEVWLSNMLSIATRDPESSRKVVRVSGRSKHSSHQQSTCKEPISELLSSLLRSAGSTKMSSP